MNFKKADKLCNILSLLGIGLALSLYLFEEINALFTILIMVAVALVAGALMVKIMYYKCPHCQNWLPFRSKVPEYCPSCRKKLES